MSEPRGGLSHWLPRGAVALVVLAAVTIVAVSAWQDGLRRMEAAVDSVMQDRARQLYRSLQRAESVTLAMRESFVFSYRLASLGQFRHPMVTSALDLGPGAEGVENVYAITGAPDGAYRPGLTPLGTLTGSGRARERTRSSVLQANAALSLDPLLFNALQRVDDAVWAYYLSADKLVYIVPRISPSSFSYRPSLHDRSFWKQAQPSENIERRPRISEVYDDAGRTGLLTTISAPVWIGNRFLGITAVDIGLATLSNAITDGELPGHSSVIDESGLQVAALRDFEPGASAGLPEALRKSSNQRIRLDGRVVWASELFPRELWLVHEMRTSELWRSAALHAAPEWALLALLVALLALLARLRNMVDTVQQLALHDPLTGVMNRRAFEDAASSALARCDREGRDAAVMMVDADHFKRVNDGFGHAVGDDVLVGIAQCIRRCSRDGDLFGRYGGEEFVLCSPFTSLEEAVQHAERLRSEVAKSPFSEEALTVTISVGVAERVPHQTLRAALGLADIALYRAKRNGRNRVEATVADGTVDLDELPSAAEARDEVRRTGDTYLVAR